MKASSAGVPRKKPKLGQHFLADTVAPIRIVEALGDVSQTTVLEIGPGQGALTSQLARRARRVIAVETDRVLAAQLRMKFSLTPNIEIIEGDILAVDFNTLFGPKPGSSRSATRARSTITAPTPRATRAMRAPSVATTRCAPHRRPP